MAFNPLEQKGIPLDQQIRNWSELNFLLPDGADEATLELAILEAVILAETKCHADWSLIQKLTQEMPEGGYRNAFQAAVDQVEEQEDEHIRWARETWETLIMDKLN